MKKIFLTLIIFMVSAVNIFAQEYTLNNQGYAERYGMVGVYGLMPDYINKHYGDGLEVGGGAFVYYNVLNDFWGNLSIGVSAEYNSGAYQGEKISGFLHSAPVAFNIAYMTASDFLNVWAGVGVSYNSLFLSARNVCGTRTTLQEGVFGGDFFAGAEYMFTQDGRWGIFFEFRYTIAEQKEFHINDKSETLDTQRFRYAVGFSYHF